MLTKYTELEHQALNDNTRIVDPFIKEQNATLESPAIDVMTDFTKIIPATISGDLNIDDASSRVKAANIRLLFVVNESSSIIGLITATDLFGEAPIKLSQELRIPRNELKIAQIMTSFYKLTAIPYDRVEVSSVGHIVKSLHEYKRQHTLVLDKDNEGNQVVRGMFSNSQIAKQLGLDVTLLLGGSKTLVDLL